jgi:thiamine biosynthesis lipoprotein
MLRIESSLDAMGSTFTIVAYDEDSNKLQQAVDIGFEEVRRLDALLSNYQPLSEWSRVNREAAERPVRVSPELFRLLEACRDYSRASDGAFDISVGPLLKIWGFYKGSGRLPHRAEIRSTLARVGYENVIQDREELTVAFRRSGVELDPGGIGKGYAVDSVVELLKERGIRSAMITAGGSSIYGLGAPPNETGWPVKIRHPKRRDQTVAEIVLNNLSMSTSGTSEKFFVSGGRLYSHIFDPRTGFPAAGMLSVSVVASRTLDSEAWTKPVFINGRDWSRRRMPKQFRAFLCEDKPDTPCAWLQ